MDGNNTNLIYTRRETALRSFSSTYFYIAKFKEEEDEPLF